MSRLGILPTSWLWQDRIPLGEITLVPGREGVGKSIFLAWLAARITRGELPGECEGRPRSVIYFAREDSIQRTLAPRLVVAGADMDLVSSRVYRAVESGRTTLGLPDIDRADLVRLCREHGVAAIMCDPLISSINANPNRTQEVRAVLEPLRDAAEEANVALIGLAHFNKNDGDVLTKVAGSRGWVEVARAALGLARGDGDSVPEEVVVVTQVRNNLGRLDLPSKTFTIVGAVVPSIIAGKPARPGRLVWGQDVDTTVHDLLAAQPGRPRKREGEGISAWVSAESIERGEMVTLAEIVRHFREHGLSDATVAKRLKEAVDAGMLERAHGHYGAVGQAEPTSAVDPAQVCAAIVEGASLREIGRRFGVHPQTARRAAVAGGCWN